MAGCASGAYRAAHFPHLPGKPADAFGVRRSISFNTPLVVAAMPVLNEREGGGITGEISYIEIGSGDALATAWFMSALFGWSCRPMGQGGDGWFRTLRSGQTAKQRS